MPSNQPPKILGVIFDSCGFPDQDRKDDKASTRLTVAFEYHIYTCVDETFRLCLEASGSMNCLEERMRAI